MSELLIGAAIAGTLVGLCIVATQELVYRVARERAAQVCLRQRRALRALHWLEIGLDHLVWSNPEMVRALREEFGPDFWPTIDMQKPLIYSNGSRIT